jgi:PKD repeat protein
MHTNSSSPAQGPARTSRLRTGLCRVVLPLAVASVVLFGMAGAALATTAPYGEVDRFGGFGSSSGSEPVKFTYPVGFAVDPSDGNAVYVLDRTKAVSSGAGGELGYRLQKISSTGSHEVLGSVTLPVEHYSEESGLDAHPLVSLAVDPEMHRVYALVESIVETEEEGIPGFVPVADRLVAWSTVPNDNKELVPAANYPTTDSVTGAALVAQLPTPEPAQDLYAPAGLTVTGGHEVVIEAQKGVEPFAKGGPTILQRVITEGSAKGTLGESWEANSTIAPQNEQADGIFSESSPSGSLGIDLFEGEGKISRLASVEASFGTAKGSPIAPDTSNGIDLDEAPTTDSRFTVNYNTIPEGESAGALILKPYTAGSPITQLSNSLYAARYAKGGGFDLQAELAPWESAGKLSNFWFARGTEVGLGNVGIRLFEGDGHVVGTIGGGSRAGVCSLDTARVSVAAGSNGSLFVLTKPEHDGEESDNQIVEFAENGQGTCPQPSGAPSVTKGAVSVEPLVPANGGGDLKATVTEGVPVTLDAITINRAGGAPYEFDWNFEEQTSGGTAGTNDGYVLGSKIQTPTFTWPTPEIVHTYAKAGTYKTTVRMIGDYGTKVFPIEMKVLAGKPPLAKLAAPSSSVAGQTVTFDGSGSEASSSIIKYIWDFGDGSTKETSGAQVQHVFASAGQYTVKLQILDTVGEEAAAPASAVVTVTPPEEIVVTPPGAGTTPAGSGSSIVTPPVSTAPNITPPPAHESATSKPLTNAQKLAGALKTCKKRKTKEQRASCEKQVRKRFAPKAKHKAAKKKSTKKK